MPLPSPGCTPEVILSVFSSISIIQNTLEAGLLPVFADPDAQSGVLTARSVEDQVSLFTKAVIATPVAGLMPDLEAIARITAPRGIELRAVPPAPSTKMVEIAPGVSAAGTQFLLVDENLIEDGRAGLARELARAGIPASLFSPAYGFECNLPQVRGRRRDFPGAATLANRGLVLDTANALDPDCRRQILAAAQRAARQTSFAFMFDADTPARKWPVAQAASLPAAIAL